MCWRDREISVLYIRKVWVCSKNAQVIEPNDKNAGEKGCWDDKDRRQLGRAANRVEQAVYRIDCAIDKVQQYSRRDCLEITGIPILPEESPKQLIKEIGTLIDVNVEDVHLQQFTGFWTPRMWSIGWLSSLYIEIKEKKINVQEMQEFNWKEY